MKITDIQVTKYCAETNGYTLHSTLDHLEFQSLALYCGKRKLKYMILNNNTFMLKKMRDVIIHFYSEDHSCLISNVKEIEVGKQLLTNLIQDIHQEMNQTV